ncbi:MAG: hypothetical protein LBL91_06110 [Lachnospiraceae bacterium]|jgi:hypothetical protein|nr:hypothetical protein [Lachnospiraceae bacterium]
MSDEIRLNAFPSSNLQALAFLYVQNQDLTGKTPAQVAKMYFEAYKEIQDNNREIRK